MTGTTEGRQAAGRRLPWPELLLALAVLASGVFLGLFVGQVATPASDAAAEDALVQDGGRVVLLLSGGALEEDAEALRVLEAQGQVVVEDATGFATGEPPLGQLVTRYLPDPDLDLVAVQGGEADGPQANVEIGALHMIDRIRAGAGPRTAVVLIGPVPEGPTPSPALLRVRDALARAAAARGVPFLDPVRLEWRSDQSDLTRRVAEALVPLVPQAG